VPIRHKCIGYRGSVGFVETRKITGPCLSSNSPRPARSIPCQIKIYFPLIAQTGCGTHQVSYSKGTGCPVLRVKWIVRTAQITSI